MSKKLKIGGFKTPIWKACASDNHRPALHHAHIKDGYIYATDAHIAVIQSLKEVHDISAEEIAILDGKFFSVSILKALDKCDVVIFKEDGIHVTIGKVRAVYQYDSEPGKYPDIEAVVPQPNQKEPVARFGINYRLLQKLGEIMNTDTNQLALEFFGETRACVVTKANGERSEQHAIIMPVILNN